MKDLNKDTALKSPKRVINMKDNGYKIWSMDSEFWPIKMAMSTQVIFHTIKKTDKGEKSLNLEIFMLVNGKTEGVPVRVVISLQMDTDIKDKSGIANLMDLAN